MQLLLFKNFSKRRNSTKQVDDSTGIVTDVVLKQGTSIESPVFLIQGVDLEVNYVKFNNHYFSRISSRTMIPSSSEVWRSRYLPC